MIVWDYFTFVGNNECFACCEMCGHRISLVKTSTYQILHILHLYGFAITVYNPLSIKHGTVMSAYYDVRI